MYDLIATKYVHVIGGLPMVTVEVSTTAPVFKQFVGKWFLSGKFADQRADRLIRAIHGGQAITVRGIETYKADLTRLAVTTHFNIRTLVKDLTRMGF